MIALVAALGLALGSLTRRRVQRARGRDRYSSRLARFAAGRGPGRGVIGRTMFHPGLQARVRK